MEDEKLRLKVIIGFGETEDGTPITLYYYSDKVNITEKGKFDIDNISIDIIVRKGYGKLFTLKNLCEITEKSTKTIRRIIKKMKERNILREQPLRKKGKIINKLYYINDEVYGIEETKRLYGTDEFYINLKFAIETEERNFIEGYPKPKNGKYYYNENL